MEILLLVKGSLIEVKEALPAFEWVNNPDFKHL